MSAERTDVRHFAKGVNGNDRYTPVCGTDLTAYSVAPTPVLDWEAVTCPACLTHLAGNPLTLGEFWAAEREGVEPPTPLHQPPVINEFDAGIFEFYDVDYNAEGQLRNRTALEVVPQTTGNVEITIQSMGNEDLLFTLHHLDRADLIRALLHDFHYSPERGGPNDQD